MFNSYKKRITQIVALTAVLFMVSGCGGSSSSGDKKTDKATEAYSWSTGNWSTCSGECGTGNATQTRTVTCESSSGEVVADSMCSGQKPVNTQSCTASQCETQNPILATKVIKKTGQTESYTDYDDGFYQKGVHRNYTRGNDIVIDHATGLQWQDSSVVKDWYKRKRWPEAIEYCQDLSFGGYTDWRLPSIEELQTIVDLGRRPVIDPVFQNDSSYIYWSSTESINPLSALLGEEDEYYYVWIMHFLYGITDGDYPSDNTYHYVRCVRGEELPKSSYSRNSTTGIVTDNATGLMWQDNEVGSQTDWQGAIDRCENLALGGYSDWRLPNNSELLSIVDYSKADPAISDTFKNTSLHYFSSTSYSAYPDNAYGVSYYIGINGYSYTMHTGSYVRCVRGGE